MKKQRVLMFVFFIGMTLQIRAQSNKYDLSSNLFINGEQFDPKTNLVIDANTKFEIKSNGKDTIENIEITAFLLKGGKIVNQDFFASNSIFNKNFNYSFFKKAKIENRLYLCIVNKDVEKVNSNVTFGNNEFRCDKLIMIPFKKKK